MNTRTGKIYLTKDAQAQADLEANLRTKLVELTPNEYEVLSEIPDKERAEKLALMRFIDERKRLGAPYGPPVQNAFRLGYRAALKDNA